ncbi:MAG: hypothetical protein ACR2H2_10275 [Solirubrobacteraceae bacterium]
MSDQPPQLTDEQILALKFAAHRQLAHWADKPEPQPRQLARRAALIRAVRVLKDRAFTDGCQLHATSDG